jgi:metal-dependent amidase/aminoacylase/carboxypeptidase family protein
VEASPWPSRRSCWARTVLDDGLMSKVPRSEVVLAQHVLPYPAGWSVPRPGSCLPVSDNQQVTAHGQGAHGSNPQTGVDPVVTAAMCPARFQAVSARETGATESVVVTVGEG